MKQPPFMIEEPMDTKRIYEQLLAAKHTSAYKLEKNAGLGNKTITSAMKRNTGISMETAIKINAVYPDVNIQWLRTGEGKMLIEKSDKDGGSLAGLNSQIDFVRQVPFEDFMEARVLIREARAGYLSAHGDEQYVNDKLPSMLVPREFEKGNYLVIETVGNSMDDGTHRAICDGDKLLAKEVQDIHWTDNLPIHRYLYIISTKFEAPVVKQITEIDEKKKMIVCHSWNMEFEDYPVFFDDIDKLFVVKKVVERQITL